MEHPILMKGIDVYSGTGQIDWEKLKASGIEFAIIRVAWRGYGASGKLQSDSRFEYNIREANRVGMHIGAYVFSQATSDAEAIEEANLAVKLLEPYRKSIDLPVVFDYEGYGTPSRRVYGSTREQRTRYCKLFHEVTGVNGYKAMLYGSQAHIKKTYDCKSFDCPLWVAKYRSTKTPIDDEKYFPDLKDQELNERIAIWQYASCGRLDAVPGRNLDLNNMYIDITQDLPVSAVCPYKMPSEAIKYSSLAYLKKNEGVSWIQWHLTRLGYHLDIDGRYGKDTLAKVLQYQKDNDLTDCTCGTIGMRTIRHIYAAYYID